MIASVVLYLNVILPLSVLYILYVRLSHVLKHYVIYTGNTSIAIYYIKYFIQNIYKPIIKSHVSMVKLTNLGDPDLISTFLS